MRTVREHLQFLESQAAEVANPAAGFFGPGSMAWRLNREMVLGLIVLRALFMQVAHPKVAQGVSDHSDFRRRPLQRALSTLRAQQAIVFGDCAESIEALMRIYARHTQVRGELGDEHYEANDPELLFWVYATLIDSMFYAYRRFLPDLSAADWDRFYEEGKLFARLIGIDEDNIPADLTAFERWIDNMLASDEISVIPVAREIGESLLSMPVRLAAPISTLLTAGTLPPKLRREFGLPWGRWRKAVFDFFTGLVRVFIRVTPWWLRTSPAYWLALRRAADG